MGFPFVLKQLVVSTRRATIATNRYTKRFFFSGSGISDDRLAPLMNYVEEIRECVPHSLCVTEANGSVKTSLNIPGKFHKTKETAETLCCFVDMGPLIWEDYINSDLNTKIKKERNVLSILASANGAEIFKYFSGCLYLPGDSDIYKTHKTEKTDGGLMVTMEKTQQPERASCGGCRFSYIESKYSIERDFADSCNQFVQSLFKVCLFSFPHTLCYTTRVTDEGELGIKITSNQKSGLLTLCLAEGSEISINTPGIEETIYTPSAAHVQLDLKLGDLDDQILDFHVMRIKELDVLYIKGYVQKQDIRRHIRARVDLQPNSYCPSTPDIKTKIVDGVLMVTIPYK